MQQKIIPILPEHVTYPVVFSELLAQWISAGWLVKVLTVFGPQGGVLVLEAPTTITVKPEVNV